MKDVRTVIWDCDNVMWFHKKEEAQIVANELKITGIDEFLSEFHSFFYNFLVHFRNKKVNVSETLKLIEKNMPILEIYQISPKNFLRVLSELKMEVNDFNHDTLVVLEYLRDKNIKCIIKSDWWRSTQEEILSYYGVMDYIEEIHCCDNAYLKCNPLSAKGIIRPEQKEQYVIIGDSLENDIAFAKHAGIKSIWLNKNQIKNETLYNPDFEITSLLEVMKII